MQGIGICKERGGNCKERNIQGKAPQFASVRICKEWIYPGNQEEVESARNSICKERNLQRTGVEFVNMPAHVFFRKSPTMHRILEAPVALMFYLSISEFYKFSRESQTRFGVLICPMFSGLKTLLFKEAYTDNL